jgi:5-(carboxyamino)imidazole ribonucleotide mutase
MPAGVPVATVGINQAKNAGLLALQILAVAEPLLQKKMVEYKKHLEAASLDKNQRLKNK